MFIKCQSAVEDNLIDKDSQTRTGAMEAPLSVETLRPFLATTILETRSEKDLANPTKGKTPADNETLTIGDALEDSEAPITDKTLEAPAPKNTPIDKEASTPDNTPTENEAPAIKNPLAENETPTTTDELQLIEYLNDLNISD